MPIPRSSTNSSNPNRGLRSESSSTDQFFDLPELGDFNADNDGLPDVGSSLPDVDDNVVLGNTEKTVITSRPSVHERTQFRRAAQDRVGTNAESRFVDNDDDDSVDDSFSYEDMNSLDSLPSTQGSTVAENTVSNEEESQGSETVENPKRAKPKSSKKIKENRKDSKGQDVFIDEKNLKLLPYGSTHKSRKAKEHEFDNRANTRRKAVIVRYAVIGLTSVLVVLGVKNAVFPPESLNADQVATISQQSIGETGFPTERGEAFAKDFMGAYLNTSADNADMILSYFYTGEITPGGSASLTNRNIGSNFEQRVIGGPSVYESVPLTDHSARYTIGALVESSVKPESLNAEQAELLSAPVPRWSFYNVNVFYDKENDTFQVTPESPTVVSSPEVGSRSDLPDPEPLGTGQADSELAADVASVVYGYLQGYSQSSSIDHAAVDQYITDSNDISLIGGLDGRYEFAAETPKDAISFQAFPDPDTEGVKVLATVKWQETSSDITEELPDSNIVNSSSSINTSSYVLTLLPSVSDGEKTTQYLVAKFQPYYFVAEQEEQ